MTTVTHLEEEVEQQTLDEYEDKEPLVGIQDFEDESRRGWWKDVRPYSIYVLLLLLLAYLFNQLDRYMLAITITPLAQELQFGDKACFVNKSTPSYGQDLKCNGTSFDVCESVLNTNGTTYCKWDYNGQGWDYQLLAGPVFILIYTFAGIFIGFAADQYNRKLLLAICLTFWSVMTLLTGFVTEYWQLALLRFGLGLGEAGCTPFAASLITDYFRPESRGAALGVYNFGIYFGYGLSYAVGNFITLADINGQGWRWAFILPGIPGIILGVVIALTLREPSNSKKDTALAITNGSVQAKTSMCTRLLALLKAFTSPSLLLLCVAGSVRNAGGYVWAYNTQPYFDATGVSKETIGAYMSWIPLVSGSIGVLFGGFIADRIIKNRGLYARIIVIVASQLLGAPFAAGALFLNVPWAFISLIPANIIGEMWVGVTLAVGMELVDKRVRTSAVAFYLFIISNVGGNVPLLVPFLQKHFEGEGYSKADALRGALYILYPGLFALSGFLFLLTMIVVKRDQQRVMFTELNDPDDS